MLLVGALATTGGLLAFEPWRLFTSSRVDEPVPTSAERPSGRTGPDPASGEERTATASPAPRAPRDLVLSQGDFVDAEHATSGSAAILELADGQRFLRLEGLATSDGPDLHVWLSDQPSGGAWGSYDDGAYVALGELKATHGDHNYEIPSGISLRGLGTAVIWCDRFDVAFGTARLDV